MIRKILFFDISYSHQPTYMTPNKMANGNNEGIIFTIFHIGGSNEGNNIDFYRALKTYLSELSQLPLLI